VIPWKAGPYGASIAEGILTRDNSITEAAIAAGRNVVKAGGTVVAIVVATVLAGSWACEKAPVAVGPLKIESGTTPSFPDRIVYVSDEQTFPLRQIYIIRSDGSQRTRITHDLNDYIHPIFSPDGATILAVATTMDSSDAIYSVNADGSNLKNLSNSRGDDNFASYSPDGSKIVFVSTRDGNSEIYIMDSDGANQTRLTESGRIDHAPQFTPDGLKILYCSTDDNSAGIGSYDFDLYVMNRDGSGKICLTEEQSCHIYPPFAGKGRLSEYIRLKPSISSDGARILFSSYDWRTDNNRVLLMDADGANCRLVAATDFMVAPVFAPGNSRIVFMSHRAGKYDLFEMNLDGTKQTKITSGTPGHVIFSEFSPDGSTILLSTDVGSLMTGSHQTVWTMSRNGSVQTQLTFDGGNSSCPHFQPLRK
jgi:Tol biopolymer transport system component